MASLAGTPDGSPLQRTLVHEPAASNVFSLILPLGISGVFLCIVTKVDPFVLVASSLFALHISWLLSLCFPFPSSEYPGRLVCLCIKFMGLAHTSLGHYFDLL
jgi:hypothetical protein